MCVCLCSLQISSWTDPGRLLKLPPVAVLALHFVLVDLPARLRTPNSYCARSAAPPASSSSVRGGSPSAVGDGEGRTGPAATASPAASSGNGGGVSGGCSGVGTAGGVDMEGGGGVGSVAQLGDVPSYVFDVVLPSDPAFDAEVSSFGGSACRGAGGGWRAEPTDGPTVTAPGPLLVCSRARNFCDARCSCRRCVYVSQQHDTSSDSDLFPRRAPPSHDVRRQNMGPKISLSGPFRASVSSCVFSRRLSAAAQKLRTTGRAPRTSTRSSAQGCA